MRNKGFAAMCLCGALLLSSTVHADSAAPSVSVIGLIGNKAILRIDGEQVILAKGETRQGVLLMDIIAGQAVMRVGGRDVSLGLGMDTAGITQRGPSMGIELVMNRHGQFITSGLINARVVEFLVDTGANTVSMTAEDARLLGIDYKVIGQKGQSVTAGGVVDTWAVNLASVKVGPIVVKNVLATVREAPRMSPILLGMSFLSQVKMEHDQNKLRLRER